MGYDFMLMPLKKMPQRTYPLSAEGLDESDCQGELPWPAFRGWLLGQGGRENGGSDSIWVEYADTGSINFNGSEESVYLDVHSEWENVLIAFQEILRHTSDCALFDFQSGLFHDETSFRRLMAENS